jgi:uncharacterized protein (TIGR02246 family)
VNEIDPAEVAMFLAIRQLSARYNRYADAADGEAFASLFTPDGVFEIRGNQYVGRREIAEVCARTTGVVHITTDPLIDIDGDRARQTSRVIAVRAAPDKSEVYFVSTGMYTDELVRTAAGWRFVRRRGELDLGYEQVRRMLGTVG